MNNDLFSALKRLLENTIGPKDLALFNEQSLALTSQADTENLKHINCIKEDSLRIFRSDELKKFTQEGLDYYYFLKGFNFFTGELREELLNSVLTHNNTITPYTLKVTLFNLLSSKMTPMDKLFLDFILTPKISTKH